MAVVNAWPSQSHKCLCRAVSDLRLQIDSPVDSLAGGGDRRMDLCMKASAIIPQPRRFSAVASLKRRRTGHCGSALKALIVGSAPGSQSTPSCAENGVDQRGFRKGPAE